MKNKVLILTCIFITTISLFSTIYHNYFSEKTAIVDLNKLNNEFVYKKELEKKLEMNVLIKKRILDSLQLNLELQQKVIGNNTNNSSLLSKYQILEDDYFNKQQQFEQSTNDLKQQYSDEIWNQLNQYVQEYGEKHNYTYILGANGSGSLMYSEKKKEITEELIEFVNEKHNGK